MRAACVAIGISIFLWAAGIGAKDFQFPEFAGWKLSGEIQTFESRTLYEYIDGAADLYLTYGFEELKVAEYQNDRKANVTVDVYWHRTPNDAFGIYSQERLPNAKYNDIGIQGYSEKEILNFLAGNYYVKITGFKIESEEVLTSFARKVAENLGEKGSLPSLLASFPREGKVKDSEKYIAKNFLGYSFLHSAFTADYEIAGRKFKLFIMEFEGESECANMIQKYLEQTGKRREVMTEGEYTILDPHHGPIEMIWKGNYLWGVLNLDNTDLRLKYL
ncbi:MAG TPA: DUF6599 family protein, partial [Thermodesulfobacteriota bacterium]|nr:DUF6599 family protein [Thermodesulfobacteriota bacterium]